MGELGWNVLGWMSWVGKLGGVSFVVLVEFVTLGWMSGVVQVGLGWVSCIGCVGLGQFH